MSSDTQSTALTKLRTAIGAVALALFWKRLRHELQPHAALRTSLSRRWSASSLKDVLAALPLSPVGLTAGSNESVDSSDSASQIDTSSPPPLSQTWSPQLLTKFFRRFRRGSPLAPAAPRFASWCDFQEDSLHYPDWGYYSDGRVVFGENAETDDFTTFPVSMRPAFGAMLADRLCSLWRAMGSPADSPFLIVELGAGTGVLAHDILSSCEANLPAAFWAACRYVIAERSASLRVLQAETNVRFVADGKLCVVPADAQDIGGSALRETLLAVARRGAGPALPTLRGAVISNELPDAFGVEKVLVSARPAAATSAAASRSAPVAAPALSGGFGSEAQRLRMQRAHVVPLIRLGDVRAVLSASDEPLPPALQLEALVACSRAHRAALLTGERAGSWELGYAGEQLLPAAAAALDEWLHHPPPPPPPPPLRLSSPSVAGSPPSVPSASQPSARRESSSDAAEAPTALTLVSPPTASLTGNAPPVPAAAAGEAAAAAPPSPMLSPLPLFARTWSSLSQVLPSPRPARRPATPPSPAGWVDGVAGGAASPAEWLHLSRATYRALKGRCCRAAGAAVPAILERASTEPADAADAYGSPLEAALDRAIVIAEAFEVVSLVEPATDRAATATAAAAAAAAADAADPTAAGQATAALRRWLSFHAPLLRSALRRRPEGERLELYPSPYLPALGAGLASLLDEGAVVTIDYGADAATLINAARRLPAAMPTTALPAAAPPSAAPAKAAKSAALAAAAGALAAAASRSSSGMRVRTRLPAAPGKGAALALRRPGWCDLTTDVDFSELSAAGEAAGLRTVFFGPQTALQRVLGDDHYCTATGSGSGFGTGTVSRTPPVVPPRVTDATPALKGGVSEAFYALGSFVMLVQATPDLASSWAWRVASQPLFGAGHPSLGQMALLHTLRALGRLALETALMLQAASATPPAERARSLTAERQGLAVLLPPDDPTPLPTERELVAALADKLVLAVPCFRPHWRKMASGVLKLLHEERAAASGGGAGAGTGAESADDALPPLYRAALLQVKDDLEHIRRG